MWKSIYSKLLGIEVGEEVVDNFVSNKQKCLDL
jgi:hypothetical protein